jgi:glutathione S-transferase
MKLYDCATAPSPRRVRIFLAEKNIAVPTAQVNLREAEQFSPAFQALNPARTVPVLDLENGTIITDAVAICLYFENLQPEPSLMGRGAEEEVFVTAYDRRAEPEGFYVAMEAFRSAAPVSKGKRSPGQRTTIRSRIWLVAPEPRCSSSSRPWTAALLTPSS